MLNGLTKISILFFLVFSIGCNGFDQELIPKTHRTFVLAKDSVGFSRIFQHENDNFNPFETSFSVGDILMDRDVFWISNPQLGEIHKISPQDDSRIIYPLEGISPLYLFSGEKYLLISDTLNEKIVVWSKKKSRTEFEFQNLKIVRGDFLGGFFFLQNDCCEIIILNEKAIAIKKRVHAISPIIGLSKGPSSDIYFLEKDSSGVVIEKRLDGSAHIIMDTERVVSFTDIKYTPYHTRYFSSMWPQNVWVTDTTFSSPILPYSVNEMDVDFFMAEIWFAYKDSIRYYNIWNQEIKGSYYLSGELQKTEHWVH